MLGDPPAYLFALLAAIIWALGGVIVKRGVSQGASALLLATASAFFGTVIFWGVLFVERGVNTFFHLTLMIVVIFAVAALLASFVGRLLHFVGIDRVGATVAQTAVTTHPMFAVLFAFVLIGEPVRLVEIVGVLVIIGGLVVLSLSRGGDIKGWKPRELLIPIGAAFLFGAGDSLRRYAFVTTSATPVEGTAMNSIVALTAFGLYTVSMGKRDVFRVPPETYKYVIAAGVLTPLGLLSLMTGLSLGRVVVVVPLAATAPLFTILFSYVLIGDLERITRGLVVGAVFVVLGIYLVTGV